MMTTARTSLISTRGRTSLVVAVSAIVALLVGPAIPAYAAAEPAEPTAAPSGPANLRADFDGFSSATIAWDAAPRPSTQVATDSYELAYTDIRGAVQRYELAELSATLYDLGYGAAPVEVRALYSDETTSDWSELEVTVGSLANLAAEIDRITPSGTHTTLSSANAFDAALAAAKDLVAGGTAVGAPVGAAFVALAAADRGRVDYTPLITWIERIEAEDVPDSSPGLLSRLSEALASTRALQTAAAADPTADVTPEQIERTLMELDAAYGAVIEIPERLGELLAQAEVWVGGASAAVYTSYSRSAVGAAVAEAHAALDDRFATSGSLDAAADSLESALASRLSRPDALVDAFSLYDTVDTAAGYTAASLAALASAYAAATTEDARAGASTRTLGNAGNVLRDAIDALVDLSPLRAAIDRNAPGRLTQGLYTAASWNVFVADYDQAVRYLAEAAAPGASAVTTDDIAGQVDALTAHRGRLLPAASLVSAPGLHITVTDGMIVVSNPGGSVTLASGQFGYTPTTVVPPVILPTKPGLSFTPPSPFPSVSIGAPKNEGSIDCEVRRATYCNRMAAARSVAPTAALTAAAVSANAASGYVVVEVLPPTTPVNGRLNVAIPLPADALTGSLFFQYTYNGVYIETAASIDIARPAFVYAADVAADPVAVGERTTRTRLASTGIEPANLFGGALLVLALGTVLTLRRARGSRATGVGSAPRPRR